MDNGGAHEVGAGVEALVNVIISCIIGIMAFFLWGSHYPPRENRNFQRQADAVPLAQNRTLEGITESYRLVNAELDEMRKRNLALQKQLSEMTAKEEVKEFACLICYNAYGHGRPVVLLEPCGHGVCRDCANEVETCPFNCQRKIERKRAIFL